MISSKLKNRLLILSLVLNVLFVTGASFYIIKNTKGFNQKYLMRFKKEKLIMFGDSHTNRGDWSELLSRRDVLKMGYGGFATNHLVYIMRRAIVDRNASFCFVQGGGNDISNNRLCSDQLISNLESIVNYLKSNNITPVLQSLFHRPDDSYNRIIDSLNINIEQLAKNNSIDYIDVNRRLINNDKIENYLLPDKIHLNQKGYEIWGMVIKEYLREKGI
ncbi:MAG: hypothetical protein K8R74_11145 [Bacteroidales bacterium]|nr:hypothetical protein [Bacteroidales bacterium]